MAAYMTISSRFPSWRDCHLSKKKEAKGFPKKTEEVGGILATPQPFVGDQFGLMKAVDWFEGEAILLFPAGGNRVSVIHNCFKADVKDGSGLSIFGIFGSRVTSPIKRLGMSDAIKHQLAPKVTRSQERKEEWAPSAKILSKCKNAKEFKSSFVEPGGGGYSATELWKYPQCCFVDHAVLEAFGEDCTKEAGDLAMEILRTYRNKKSNDPKGENKTKDPEKEFNVLLFLWAVENSWMKKVPLYEAPDNENLDRLVQKVWKKLEKKEEAKLPEGPNPPSIASRGTSQSSREVSPKTDDRTKPREPPPDSPDKSTTENSSDEGEERGRKRIVEKGKERKSPSPSSSDSGSSSSSEEERKSPRTSKSRERSRSKSKRRSLTRSNSRSSKAKSSDSEGSDSSPRRSRRNRSSSPPSSSSDSDSDSSSSSDDSRRRPGKRPGKDKRKKRRKRQKKKGEHGKRRGRSSSISRGDRDLNRTMIRSLQAMTDSQLKRDQKADKNKSMLSRLSPEAGSLFRLLSATGWNDWNPRLPSLTKKILEDRDSNRALGEVKSLSKRWTGKISEKGFLLFLANGYQADDITEAPGGFSVFSFSPLDHVKSSDPKTNVHQVRSMFGSTELDEESIKYFAKKDFYLADSLAGLEEQIYTCIKCLEMLTRREGIAAEGYVYGFEMLSRYKREFIALYRMDHLFPVKFAYLLDRVFQNFVQDLGDFHSKSDPIKKARKSLKGQQVREINAAMIGFKTGSLSHLFLPRTLQGGTPVKDTHPSTDGGAKGTGGGRKTKTELQAEEGAKEKTPPEEWWSTNPSPVAAWKTPEGKSFSEIFDHQKDSLKANTESWPKFKSHNPHRRGRGKTFLCLRYQTEGKCPHTCKAAHVIPEKIPAAERKIMDDRFKKIYN
jgi:hypothetical protein